MQLAGGSWVPMTGRGDCITKISQAVVLLLCVTSGAAQAGERKQKVPWHLQKTCSRAHGPWPSDIQPRCPEVLLHPDGAVRHGTRMVSSCPQSVILHENSGQACFKAALSASWACNADSHGMHGGLPSALASCNATAVTCAVSSHIALLCDWQHCLKWCTCAGTHVVQRSWRSRAVCCWSSMLQSSIVASSGRNRDLFRALSVRPGGGTVFWTPTTIACALVHAIPLLPCSLSEGPACIPGH